MGAARSGPSSMTLMALTGRLANSLPYNNNRGGLKLTPTQYNNRGRLPHGEACLYFCTVYLVEVVFQFAAAARVGYFAQNLCPPFAAATTTYIKPFPHF